MARAAVTGFAVLAEHVFELREQVRLGSEMAEILVARLFGFRHDLFHFLAVVAMESVTLDECSLDIFAEENVLEGVLDGRGTGTGRARNRQDGMFSGHERLLGPYLFDWLMRCYPACRRLFVCSASRGVCNSRCWRSCRIEAAH